MNIKVVVYIKHWVMLPFSERGKSITIHKAPYSFEGLKTMEEMVEFASNDASTLLEEFKALNPSLLPLHLHYEVKLTHFSTGS